MSTGGVVVTCCHVPRRKTHEYQQLVDAAIVLGCDSGYVMQQVLLMREHDLPPNVDTLMDMLGVGRKGEAKGKGEAAPARIV